VVSHRPLDRLLCLRGGKKWLRPFTQFTERQRLHQTVAWIK